MLVVPGEVYITTKIPLSSGVSGARAVANGQAEMLTSDQAGICDRRAAMNERAYIAVLVMIIAFAVPSCGAHPDASGRSTPIASELVEANRFDALVVRLREEGKFQEAVSFAERSLALREAAMGSRHPGVADSLSSLAELWQELRAYEKAEQLYMRALELREQALGPSHVDVSKSLDGLGTVYHVQGAYRKAEPLLVRALAIREQVLGATHPDVAQSLNILGLLYRGLGDFRKAEPLLVRALAIREKSPGATRQDVAESLNNLALIYQEKGSYDNAEPLYVRALDIREKVLGATHPKVAETLNNLGTLHEDRGEYAEAEPLLLRALHIRETGLGPIHQHVAQSLGNLATLYRAQGDYGKAEPLLLRALEIREKTLGPMHPEVESNLSNLAMLYRMQGAREKAEPLYVRALGIAEKILGPAHPAVARNLNDLATLYHEQGITGTAEPMLQHAIDIARQAWGAKHRHVASYLQNLALIYVARRAYSEAEPLLLEALDIEQQTLGATHPDVARSRVNLAGFYLEQGAYDKAEPLLLGALAVYERTLGAIHPAVANVLQNLAGVYQEQALYVQAQPFLGRAAEISEEELRRELARLPEPRKRALMLSLQRETDRIVSLHADDLPGSGAALELALTTVLRRKSRVLDSLAENQANLLTHLSPALRETFHRLMDANADLSTRMRSPFDPRQESSQASTIAALRARIDDLELMLNTASAEFRAESGRVTIPKIQAALSPGAALVEFVRYRRFSTHSAKRKRDARYVAYIVPWQGPAQPIALGEAAPIDARVDAVLREMHKAPDAVAARLALQNLDALLFAPIRDRLTDVSHIILAPDAKLNLVPFEALLDEQGRYALEKWLVSYVGSGRDLLRLSAQRAPRSPATILAAPYYGSPRAGGHVGNSMFRPLAGTLAEANELRAFLPQPRFLTGEQASKAALAATVGPSVLHIATHGFFAISAGSTWVGAEAPSPAHAPRGATRDLQVDSASGSSSATSPQRPEDPNDALDRAGLALAGANVRPDGIVTARELASYDWWGTKLVVLSACNTGIGAVPSGEGVYGLRRALVLAGAESQVVSLWNVSDTSTRALMKTYYGELARGTGRAESLRRAKLWLLRQRKFAHPYYWAAFIPAGDWTPLDGSVVRRPDSHF